MTDRELLELSAKAAFGSKDFVGDMKWNPLTDDGDALRLAVKLRIDFYIGDDDGIATYAGYFDPTLNNRQRFAIERHGDDPYAATRRCIVRAAAEIGAAL